MCSLSKKNHYFSYIYVKKYNCFETLYKNSNKNAYNLQVITIKKKSASTDYTRKISRHSIIEAESSARAKPAAISAWPVFLLTEKKTG